MAYVSLGNTVGSKVVNVAGGAPVPEAIVTCGPGSSAWYKTRQPVIVCPAGGAITAVTGTGLVTIEPSAGEGLVIDAPRGLFVPPGGDHTTLPTFDMTRRPLTKAVA